VGVVTRMFYVLGLVMISDQLLPLINLLWQPGGYIQTGTARPARAFS
jgi:hypothetical protein